MTERYRERLVEVLLCYDRIVITGTLPGACYAGGMTSFMYSRGIRIFDYARFAEPVRERIRARAQQACSGRSPMRCPPMNCTAGWIGTPSAFARYSVSSGSAITGA